MKKVQYIITLVLFVFTVNTHSQEIFVGSGFSSATFLDYENSEGENTLDDSGFSKVKQPLLESGIRFDLYKQRVKFDLGLHYHKYEIRTAFIAGEIRIPTTYNLSYVGAKVGLKVDVLRWKNFGLQGHVHLFHDWLVSGTNEYMDQRVDLYNDNTMDKGLMGFHRGFGLEYKVNKKIACYINYNIATSFKEANQDSNEGEAYSLDARSIRVGVLFTLSKKKKKAPVKKTETKTTTTTTTTTTTEEEEGTKNKGEND
ncbi:outer membrane beta-barrel protein [Urechidicola vernalis]|uniref:Outer membrane protein beta-barrel domain-containing protein n=1 Tax=Urechidicola vernalis TaxID=3075600 RepID=A0ABU2Y8T3_9FLAO|nr:outer membrane beta-barrel protein [Urechidicola sp. P050]MDT0554276.1 hypothetical protein [Urechidicola sp. P050]